MSLSDVTSNPMFQTGVQMVLDATGFNEKVDETVATIAKLKASMAFEGAITGLNTLADSIKNSGIDTLQTGVYKVHQEFDALNVIATTALENITNKAMNAGETLAKSLTVTPLKEGLQEYETQINSVQTILANTGDALKEQGLTSEHDRIEKINGVLDDLNKYADMTIYNFTEMTRNIGTFTAAGVELDKSANAIKGIANLAAMSGSNSEQASRAMYQLSQALSTGTLKLQDWNSVVNAGMGGKLFQEELKDTARTMGIVADVTKEVDKLDKYGNVVLDENGQAVKKKVKETITDIDQLIEHEGSFRDSLSSGWITDEILLTTLEKFTAGSEGYTKAQIAQMKDMWKARGYSEETIKSLTGSVHELTEEEEKNLRAKWAEKGFSPEQIDHILEMGSAATDAATKVKTFSQLIDTVKEALQSGWTQSWEYIFGDFEQAKRFWTEISDIMNAFIGESAESRNSMLKEWSEATYTYSEEGKLMQKIADETQESGYRLVEVQKMENDALGGREAIIQGLRNVFQGLLEVVLQLKNAFAKNFWGATEDSQVSNIVLSGKKLIEASHMFLNATQNFKDSLIGKDGQATEKLKALREIFDYLATSVRSAYDGLSKIGSAIGNVLKSIFSSTDFVETARQLATMIAAISLRFNVFGETIKKHFGGSSNLEQLTKFFKGLSDLFMRNVWDKLEFVANGVMAIINAVDRMITPFGTASDILGKVGDKFKIFSDALFAVTHNVDGSSKFDTMFKGIVDNFIKFYDVLRNNVDFSGFTKMFTNLVTALSDDKVGVFRTFTKLFEILVNIFKVALQIITPLAAAFANVFGDIFTKGAMFIASVVERIRAFSESLVANESTIKGIQHLFEGFFNIIKAIGEVLGNVFLAVWDTLVGLFKDIIPDGNAVGDTLTNIGDRFNNVADFIRGFLDSGSGGAISSFLKAAVNGLKALFNAIADLNPLQKLHDLLISLGDGLKRVLGGSNDMSLMDTIIKKLKDFFGGIKDILSTDGALDPTKMVAAGGMSVFLTNLITNIGDLSKKVGGISGIFKNIKKFLNDLSEAISAFTLRVNIDSVKVIATSILEIAAAMFILAMIDPIALAKAIGVVSLMFKEIKTLLEDISKFKNGKSDELLAAAAIIGAMGTSILLLSAAVAILGGMDSEELAKGLLAVAALLAGMVKVAEEFSKFDKNLVKGAGALIALAVAVDLITISVKALGGMSWEDLIKGLGATIVLIAALVKATKEISKSSKGFGVKQGAALILMAASIKILASAVKSMAGLSWEDIGKGLLVVAAGLAGFIATVKLLSMGGKKGADGEGGGDNKILQIAAALIAFAISMRVLVSAIAAAGNLEWDQLQQGMIVLGVGLVAFVAFSKLVNGPALLMAGIGILAIATAISELSIALNLAKVVAPLIDGLVFGINAIKDSLVNWANNEAAASFLNFLKNAVLLLPQLAIGLADALIQFVVTLGNGAAQIVGAVTNIVSSILDALITLVPKVGQVVLTTIGEIAKVIIVGAPMIATSIMTILDMFWMILTEQTPKFFEWLGTLVGEIINFLKTQGPAVLEMLKTILDTLIQVIIDEAPRIGEMLLTLLDTVLNIISTAVPKIVATLLGLLAELLIQLEAYIPLIADTALKIILGFLNAIAENIGSIVDAGVRIAIGFIDGLTSQIGQIIDSAFKFIISFINGLADAIDNNHEELFKAVGKLITSIVKAILDGGKQIFETAGNLLTEFTKGFDPMKIWEDLKTAGANLILGIKKGLESLWGDITTTAENLGKSILGAFGVGLEEQSPSKATRRMGGYFIEGFLIGTNENESNLLDRMTSIAKGAVDGFNSGLEGAADFEPTITPVIDDSGIQNGIDAMNVNFDDAVLQTASISNTLDASKEFESKLADAIIAGNDYSSITGVLGKLRGDLSNYTDKISKLQIVMDNGTLVGELIPGIDRELGFRSTLVGRGVR